MTLVEHLAELRRRLITILVVVILGTIGSYLFVEPIVFYVLRPASDLHFVYLTPPELFLVYLKLSLVMGVAITSPVSLLQVWLFLRPGLSDKEKAYVLLSLMAGIFFFLVGVLFAYNVILPLTINFFVGISMQGIEPMFSVGSYVGFISSILLAFGVVFEMPIVAFLLAKLGMITPATLTTNRKLIYLGIIILAAFLSPPDVISQGLLAGPMVLLFEFSVLVTRMATKNAAADADD